mmetsp:Transcript_88828/g.176606  ORF Transcript_88828/g.176606 Transcript_88828/m.176606 type:complete len:164 (-) Transcript_88828:82-573(-)
MVASQPGMLFSAAVFVAIASAFARAAAVSTKHAFEQQMSVPLDQGVDMCLRRIAPLSKAEGYGALCTSVGSLYLEQQQAATTIASLQRENAKLRTDLQQVGKKKRMSLLATKRRQGLSYQDLRRKNAELAEELQVLRGRDPTLLLQQIQALSRENAQLVEQCS